MNLESIDVAPLDVATGPPDLRRDLHVFVDYVRAREVKRFVVQMGHVVKEVAHREP